MTTTLTKIAITLPQFIKICEVGMFPARNILTMIQPVLLLNNTPPDYVIVLSPGREGIAELKNMIKTLQLSVFLLSLILAAALNLDLYNKTTAKKNIRRKLTND